MDNPGKCSTENATNAAKQSSRQKVRAGVVGATGYTGSELVKLLCGHDQVSLTCLMARSTVGRPVIDFFPALRGMVDLAFEQWQPDVLSDLEVVFFATPHGVAAQAAKAALNTDCVLIDLSADFRLRDVAVYEKWYGQAHPAPEAMQQSAYGLPELFGQQLAGKKIIGNPGCYPTSVQLGLAPLISNNQVRHNHIIIDAKSGFSGAGRKADAALLASELTGNFKAYGSGGHRHQPEIEQGLNAMTVKAGSTTCHQLQVTFVPHLLPLVRGIESSMYIQAGDITPAEAVSMYESFYSASPFVDILPAGVMPEIKSVAGTNKCQIGIDRVPGSPFLLVSAVIDNLIKGAAGQAIQNMNLLFGWDEAAGLRLLPHYP